MAWTNLSGETGIALTTDALDRDDDGSEYRLVVTDADTGDTVNSNDANAWLREHTLQYAIEITTSTSTTDTDYGLVSGVFRFITGRPGYDGVGPQYPENEDGTSNTDVWYEGWMLEDGLGNAQRSVDITKTGSYGTFSSFQFRLRNNEKFWNFLDTNNIYLLNRRVQFYVVYGDTFYKSWSGVISNVPYDETDYTVNCVADFNKVHKYIPPEVINDTNYTDADADSKGNPIPVSFGKVIYAELYNLKNELKQLDLFINSSDERINTAAAAGYYISSSSKRPRVALLLDADVDDFLIDEDDARGAYLFAVAGDNSDSSRGVRIEKAAIFGTTARQLYISWGVALPDSVDPDEVLRGIVVDLENELDTSPETFNSGVGDNGPYLYDQNAATTASTTWWFKIVKANVVATPSNDDITFEGDTPNLYTYNEQFNEYEDISFTIEESDDDNDNVYGHPYIFTIASTIDESGESSYLLRIRPDPNSFTNTTTDFITYSTVDYGSAGVITALSYPTDLNRATSIQINSTPVAGVETIDMKLAMVLDPEQLNAEYTDVYMPVDIGVLSAADVEMSVNYTIEDPYGRLHDTADDTREITLKMEEEKIFFDWSVSPLSIPKSSGTTKVIMAAGSSTLHMESYNSDQYAELFDITYFYLRSAYDGNVQRFRVKGIQKTVSTKKISSGSGKIQVYTYDVTTYEPADADFIASYSGTGNPIWVDKKVSIAMLLNNDKSGSIVTQDLVAGTDKIYLTDTSNFSAGQRIRLSSLSEFTGFLGVSEELTIASIDSSTQITTTTNLVNDFDAENVPWISAGAAFNFIPNIFYKNNGNDNNEYSLFNSYDDTYNSDAGAFYSEIFTVPSDILSLLNAGKTAKKIYINILFSSTTETTIFLKQFGVMGRRTIALVNDKLYTRITGETHNGLDSNSVYGAFRLMLEKYDEISSSSIDYDNLSTTRADWYVSRQITDRRRTFEYIRELCSHSFVCAFPTRDAKLKLKAWREDSEIIDTHDNSVIVRDSIRPISKTSLKDNFNDFYIEYHWNPALKRYEKALYITKTDESAFPGVNETTAAGNPLWWSYAGGTNTDNSISVNSGYADAKYLWDLANDAYDRTETINELPANLTKMSWYYDSKLYDEDDLDSTSTQTGAYKFLVNVTEWCTRSRDHVFYAIPINDTNLTLELLDRVYFNDSIYSNSTDWDGWIDSIQIDTRSHQMILGVTLNPDGIPEGDIEETTTAADTIDENGSRTDTITEGRTI